MAQSERSPQKLTCPACDSDNWQRVEVAYSQGTTRLRGISPTLIGGTSGGQVGIGSGLTVTNATNQSQFAATLAPPVLQPRFGYLFLVMLGVFLLLLVGFYGWGFAANTIASRNQPGGNPDFGFDVFGLGVVLVLALICLIPGWRGFKAAGRFNRDEFQTLYNNWLNQCVCLKCGNKWIRETSG